MAGGEGGGYSDRSAISGSTAMARRAGSQAAPAATARSSTDTTPKVSGSVAVTSYSSVDISRVSAAATATPIPAPARASVRP